MKYWQELKTIDDFIASCKEVAIDYDENLSKKDKEHLASVILALTFTDRFTGWCEKYPLIERIEAYASDLEWSNSSDVDEDWEKLLRYIEQLDREVNSNKP